MPVGDGTDFSQAILDEARQESDDIVDLAKREAERILDGARAELEQAISAERSRAATQRAKMRYKQLIAAAELETRKQQLLKQEELIADVQDNVRQRLLQLRNDARYPALLARCIREGLEPLDGENFEVLVTTEDRAMVTEDLLQTISGEIGATVRLSEDSISGVSGAIVQRADRRVRCDNTLQNLFKRREDEMRLLIARNVFDGIDTP